MPWMPHDGFIAFCEVCDKDDLSTATITLASRGSG
jgi:hypothetical protein